MDPVNHCNEESTDSDKNDIETVKRHCAFCLEPGATKHCSGCHRRAYCSRDCQLKDWQPNGPGQGHKNWCKMEYGEEDLDWFVTEVPGKGLGVVAKRTIPSKYRIIVEAVFTDPQAHAAIMDLAPVKGTLSDKYRVNCLAGDESRDSGRDYIALRISRVNHSCDANAGHNYCETSRVEIMYSIREIQAGEEICINYRSFNNINLSRNTRHLSPVQEFQLIKDTLRQTWGVVCQSDCFCNRQDVRELVLEGRRLATDMERLADHLRPEAALRLVPDLMKIHDQIHSAWIAKANSLYTAFQIAVMSPKTLKYAHEYIKKVHDIYFAVCPFSKATRKFRMEMENPSMAFNYMRAEN